jgi:hypothetical protein
MLDKNQLLANIIDIENRELKGLIDEPLYLKKIEMLCLLSGRDVDRVWGEYSIVQQITKQPVLMNKAMSIPLTKNEVSLLIDDLTSKYKMQLKANYIEKVNLVFSTSIRGHAKEISKEIVLPKLGDWRFGYKDVYSAELVFHEFAHLLDYGRVKVQKYGKTDIHKHDFVRILDNMLETYSKFIESKYIPSRQREQILSNSELLVDFHSNREEIEAKDKEQELKQIAEKNEQVKNILLEAGISDDNFPIHLLLQEDGENKLNYLEFAIANYEKSIPISLPLKENIKLLRENLSTEKSNLNKIQINLLVSALDKSKLNDYLLKLPLMQQLKSAALLRKFSEEVRELSKGKISSLEGNDSFKIRTYDESDRLKKRGMED